MFRNRSSHKPADELLGRFRQSFTDVMTPSTAAVPSEPAVAARTQAPSNAVTNQPRQVADNDRWDSFCDGLVPAQFAAHEDLDPTPRAAKPFGFTPLLTPSVFMDPSSAAFAAFSNQPPGLFTPTPASSSFAATTSVPANAIGSTHDLQTPGIGISLGPPLALPTGTGLPTAAATTAAPQSIQPHQFQNYGPFFQQPLQSQYLDPSRCGVRASSDPGSPMDLSGAGDLMADPMPLAADTMKGMVRLNSPMAVDQAEFDQAEFDQAEFDQAEFDQAEFDQAEFDQAEFDDIAHLLPTSPESFRFRVVLNASTAMLKHPDEIPVTYLNKGQAYPISIVDTQPPPPDAPPVKYRTFVRISFHDETQCSRPAGCWQLWKEGRGMSEAHHRGGKLQAVEYVDSQASGDDDKEEAKVVLESASFDGFSVTWSPTVSGPGTAETSVSVRFNFLSTDFSFSKGVKGIPVRLCAKTEVVSSGSPTSSPPESSTAEVCYCIVKLFRDHGAERKRCNDIVYVRKTIKKLEKQANQAEGTGKKVSGKKSKKEEEMHKRTGSISSASSVNGVRSQEEDTNAQLHSMKGMFTSRRPVSILFLRGDDADDPDLYPVRLPGGPDAGCEDSWSIINRRASVATTNTTASSSVSPSPSSASLSSYRADSFSAEKDCQRGGFHSLPAVSQADVPARVKSTANYDGVLSDWIEAIGLDSSYISPAGRASTAVMCVYILPIFPNQSSKELYHRAVYLQSRSASCLSTSIAAKCGVDPATVFRTVHINSSNLTILIDDDLVSQMNEGQDMKVQLQEITDDSSFSSPPQESSSTNGIPVDGNGGKKWELRLIY